MAKKHLLSNDAAEYIRGVQDSDALNRQRALIHKKSNMQMKELYKTLRANEAARKAAYERAIKNKTYYNKLAAQYLTDDEYKQYVRNMELMDRVRDKVPYDKYNARAKAEINCLLKKYDKDIDTLAASIPPADWKEYRALMKDYPALTGWDEAAKATLTLARIKDTKAAIPEVQPVTKQLGPYQKPGGVEVLGIKDRVAPLRKYSWDSVRGSYVPDMSDDEDVDADFWGDTTDKFHDTYEVGWKYKE